MNRHQKILEPFADELLVCAFTDCRCQHCSTDNRAHASAGGIHSSSTNPPASASGEIFEVLFMSLLAESWPSLQPLCYTKPTHSKDSNWTARTAKSARSVTFTLMTAVDRPLSGGSHRRLAVRQEGIDLAVCLEWRSRGGQHHFPTPNQAANPRQPLLERPVPALRPRWLLGA